MYAPTEIEQVAIHESKHTEKIVKFINLTIEELSQYCSKEYAKKIIKSHDRGTLWGCHFTPNGRIRAIFK